MTNKTIKAELKVYLDQLSGIVPEDDKPLARQLAHDIYDLFKQTKRPEKETVIIKEPVDDSTLRAELDQAKEEIGKLKFKLSKSVDKEGIDQQMTLDRAGAYAGGMLEAFRVCWVNKGISSNEQTWAGEALRSILVLTEADVKGLTRQQLLHTCRSLVYCILLHRAKIGELKQDIDPDTMTQELFLTFQSALDRGPIEP